MSYIITKNTLAIIPRGKKSKIIEGKHSLLANEETAKIIEQNCFLNGSTLEGRIKGSSYLLGSSYKPPIIINDSLNIILIPTHSIRNKNCHWINLITMLHYSPTNDNKVLIEFINNHKLIINVSYNIFDKQVLRATRLESTIKGRIYQKYL